MNRRVALVASLALVSHAAVQGDLAVSLAHALGVSIVEEATNEWGTIFVLLDQPSLAPAEIEEQLAVFMETQPDGSAVVVYPVARGSGSEGSHIATTVRKYPSGHTSVNTDEWGEVLRNAERAYWLDFADVVFSPRRLEYTYGSTQILSLIPETLLRDPYVPPPGASLAGRGEPMLALPSHRTTCTSGSSQFGSSITCSTNGRVTYRSICTVDSVGNISCRADSY